jgi:hypothetical protein
MSPNQPGKEQRVPRTWETPHVARNPRILSRLRPVTPAPLSRRARLYLLARSGQGFMTGVAVGVLWALWIIRRRRPGPAVLDSAAGAASRAR